ncbi:hypothetical protein [uncultured Shewanella sp.]|uniref:hypothetical protein n=1 Tax=uncultured Shewanella sp. TaxID=173975 RepID=UPI002627B3E1|nr:hypothetical protein [uncultured Shewanella sp.]
MISQTLSQQGYELHIIERDNLQKYTHIQPELIIMDLTQTHSEHVTYVIKALTKDLRQTYSTLPPVLALTDFDHTKRTSLLATDITDVCYSPLIEAELLLRVDQVCLTANKKK